MDSRIGMLNSGEYYAFPNGYDQPEVRGTIEQVEVALGLREATVKVAREATLFNVTLRFEFPAWDEKGGIVYEEIPALSKSDAIAVARVRAFYDGNAMGGKGRYWFTAEKISG